MQDEPTAARLLEAMADTLESRVLDDATGSARHQVRVVVSLCRILQREQELGPALESEAAESLAALLGEPPGRPAIDGWRKLAERLDELASDPDGDVLAAAAHPVLTEIVRGKLAVAKPGYDQPHGDDR